MVAGDEDSWPNSATKPARIGCYSEEVLRPLSRNRMANTLDSEQLPTVDGARAEHLSDGATHICCDIGGKIGVTRE